MNKIATTTPLVQTSLEEDLPRWFIDKDYSYITANDSLKKLYSIPEDEPSRMSLIEWSERFLKYEVCKERYHRASEAMVVYEKPILVVSTVALSTGTMDVLVSGRPLYEGVELAGFSGEIVDLNDYEGVIHLRLNHRLQTSRDALIEMKFQRDVVSLINR